MSKLSTLEERICGADKGRISSDKKAKLLGYENEQDYHNSTYFQNQADNHFNPNPFRD